LTHGKTGKGWALSGCYVVYRFCGAPLTYVFAGRQKRAGNEVRRATVLFGASVGKMYFFGDVFMGRMVSCIFQWQIYLTRGIHRRRTEKTQFTAHFAVRKNVWEGGNSVKS